MALSSKALVTLLQAKNYLRVDAAASSKVEAEYVGVGDGTNPTFTLDHTPLTGSYKIWVNTAGTPALQVEETDYTLAIATITFLASHIPADGAIVTASYDYATTDDTFESYDDELLERLIEAATKKAEDYTEKAFIIRAITETHIGDSKQILKLYKQPVVSITSVHIGGDELTEYSKRLSIGRLYHLIVWPLNYEIVVVYQAGYDADRGETQLLIPDAMTAVLLIVADLYENRGDKVDSINITGIGITSYKLSSRAEELLAPLRTSVL